MNHSNATPLSKAKEITLAMLITGLVLGATSCDHREMNEQERRHAAFFPTKPAHAAQVAYREEAREQLRLNTLHTINK